MSASLANSQSASVHPCVAVGCWAQVHDGALMCPKHWALVPEAMQQNVVQHREVVDRVGTGRDFTAASYSKACGEYRESILNAVDYVQAREAIAPELKGVAA